MKPNVPYHLARLEGKITRRLYHGALRFIAQRKINIPRSVKLDEGETMQQRMKKLERPEYSFFTTVELPRVLLRTTGAKALGTSNITLTGVQ